MALGSVPGDGLEGPRARDFAHRRYSNHVPCKGYRIAAKQNKRNEVSVKQDGMLPVACGARYVKYWNVLAKEGFGTWPFASQAG